MEKTSLELMLKGIVKEALREVLAEGAIVAPVVAELKKEVVKEEPKKVEKAKKQEVKVEEPEVAEDAEVDVEEDRKAELKAMKYNDLKKLVKELGGKAVGSADSIIEQILVLEESAEDSEDEEVEADAQEEATADVDDSEEEDSDDEEDEAQEAEYREFLMELDKEELLEIGKALNNPKPKTWKKESFVELLLTNIEQLEEALDTLGYFDDEDSDDEADEVDGNDTEDSDEDDSDEEEEEDSEDEEADEEEETTADQLAEMSLEDLATLCTDNGLSAKGKKQALIDRIVKAVEAGDMSLDGEESEEEDDEWYTQEELDEMSDEDLKDIADTNDLEIPMKGKGKNKKMDRDALIELIIASGEEEDEEDVEDDSDDSEEEEEGFEVSDERVEAEESQDADIRKKYKGKKLKDNTIKKFLEKYHEGNPRYALPDSKEEALEEYINIHVNLVDDEGEVHDVEDCYVRDNEYHCCGSLLDALDNGTPYCPVCGTEYEE